MVHHEHHQRQPTPIPTVPERSPEPHVERQRRPPSHLRGSQRSFAATLFSPGSVDLFGLMGLSLGKGSLMMLKVGLQYHQMIKIALMLVINISYGLSKDD